MHEPVTSLAESRAAYDAYLVLMEQEPWHSGAIWDQTVEHLRAVCVYIHQDPPDMQSVGSLWLAMAKGGGGSEVMLDSCPDPAVYAKYREAGNWLHEFSMGYVAEGQPMDVGPREVWLSKVEAGRAKCAAQMKQPRKQGYVLDNNPEGWAQIERDFKLEPGSVSPFRHKAR